MSEAPIPPKRNYKNRTLNVSVSSGPIVGAGLNVARALNVPSNNQGDHEEEDVDEEEEEEEAAFNALLETNPDVTIGEEVEIKGKFQFDGLLRLDGKFQGSFLTKGDIIVGPTGILLADITTVKRLFVDGGQVYGRIHVSQVVVRGKAKLQGEITCQSMQVLGTEATIMGRVNIHPKAPNLMDENGNGVPNSAKEHVS
jgi:cytoskeletal protein CcmA (bactofilin family)